MIKNVHSVHFYDCAHLVYHALGGGCVVLRRQGGYIDLFVRVVVDNVRGAQRAANGDSLGGRIHHLKFQDHK